MEQRPKRPTEIHLLAKELVDQATGQEPLQPAQPEKPAPREKNRAAVELGRLGGLKGGKARALKLSDERKKEIAKKAAAARWKKQ